MATRHGFGDEITTQATGSDSGDWCAEDEPDMGAVTRSRALDCSRNTKIMAGIDEGRHVFRPGFLIEVSSKEPAGFIPEQGIDTDGVPALKVVEDDLVVERQKRLVRAVAALYPGFITDAAYPLIATSW